MDVAVKNTALEALRLLLVRPPRDSLIEAIAGERYGARRVAHVTRVASTSRDDEEWSESTRFVELTYESGVILLDAYFNLATIIGAHQSYDCRLRSDEPSDAAREAQLKKWLDEWRELLALDTKGWRTSVY